MDKLTDGNYEILSGYIMRLLHLIKTKEVRELHFLPPRDLYSSALKEDLLQFVDGHLGVPINLLKLIFLAVYNGAFSHSDNSEPLHRIDGADVGCLVLLTNPNIVSLWNSRKQMILDGAAVLEYEGYFSWIVALLHPKCSAIFEHRRWLLKQTSAVTRDTIEHELGLCTNTADKYPNNYYSWSHRQFCLSLTESPQIWVSDLELVRKWREVNVSQYCAFNHCQFILEHLDSQIDNIILEYNDTVDLIKLYPNHPSLWQHRKWVAHKLSQHKEPEAQMIVMQELSLSTTNVLGNKYKEWVDRYINVF